MAENAVFRVQLLLSAFSWTEIAVLGKSHILRVYFSFILRKEVAMLYHQPSFYLKETKTNLISDYTSTLAQFDVLSK